MGSGCQVQLRAVGSSKAVESVSEEGRKNFGCATWLHKAKGMRKEGFKAEVETAPEGEETARW
jgi:hypothetical protein